MSFLRINDLARRIGDWSSGIPESGTRVIPNLEAQLRKMEEEAARRRRLWIEKPVPIAVIGWRR